MEEHNRILDFPENGLSSFRYGGFWERFLAALIDGLIVGIPGYFISQMFVPGSEEIMAMSPEEASGVMMGSLKVSSVLWVIQGLYYAYFESSEKMATIGKQVLGMKVTNLEGGRISFLNAYGRYLAKFVSAIIILIGYLMQPFTEKKQALHDMIAGTLVLKN